MTVPPSVHYRAADFDSARWERFEFRLGDIVISTPSKSGTTWMQMLCALLIFNDAKLPAPMDELSPWLDSTARPLDEVLALLDAQDHRRFIKTHTPLHGIPIDDGATYLMVGRDPRDVAVSYSHHRVNLDRVRLAEMIDGVQPPRPGDSVEDTATDPILDFIDGDYALSTAPITLAGVLDHLRTGWERRRLPNVALFHYTNLSADLVSEMRRVADVLEIDVDGHDLEALAAHAHIDQMRAQAEEFAPGATFRHWKDTAAFFRSGNVGDWKTTFTTEAKARYDARLAGYTDSGFINWAHTGRQNAF